MIKYFFRDKEESSIKEIPEFKSGAWITAEKISEAEIEKLEEEIGLESGHLRDALDPFEVPRLEIEDSGAYMFLRVPTKEQQSISTSTLLIVIGKQFVFTMSDEGFDFLDKIVSGKTKIFTNQKIPLFCLLVSENNQLYQRHISEINKKVRKIRASIERINNRDIIRFVDFEQILNDFISALVPTSISLRAILKGRGLRIDEEGMEAIEDLILSSEQLLENAKSTLKNIVNIREAYSTILSQDLNRVMKILTAMTIVVTVPTMVSSFYGMNIGLPFATSPNAFAGVLSVAIASVLILVVVFRKNRWL